MYASSTDLRRVAARLDSVCSELDGDRDQAGPTRAEVEPEWVATAALRALTAELDETLAMLSRLCGGAAEAIRSCARAYEAADDRTARRLAVARGGALVTTRCEVNGWFGAGAGAGAGAERREVRP